MAYFRSLWRVIPFTFGLVPSIGWASDQLLVIVTRGNHVIATLTDANGKPVSDAQVKIQTAMVEMDMGTQSISAKSMGKGVYTADVKFSMSGKWKITVIATSGKTTLATTSTNFTSGIPADITGMEMGNMKMSGMEGKLGSWGMQREGSGTSWLPDSSPMFMKSLGTSGRYEFNTMGSFSLNYTSSGGKRGEDKFFSNSMPMLMVGNSTGGGHLEMDLMMSLDPIFNGETGYPDLFQTGETAHGQPQVDRQHPHNLISELAVTYSHPIGASYNAFIYGGPIAEPALGGPMYLHRPSGMEIPEAPITHHWFDSTHISSGVITTGVNNHLWQLEGSLFNGHEPGENRYWPQPLALNSASGRFTLNPTKDLSLSTSYGYLASPEADAPGVNQTRTTASALYNFPLKSKDSLATTLYWGRIVQSNQASDGYLAEATYYHKDTSLFVRWENVDKNDLYDIPAGSYRINKFLFGGVQNIKSTGGFDFGVGGYGGLYAFPSSLEEFYGKSPVTFGVFLRVRPSRM